MNLEKTYFPGVPLPFSMNMKTGIFPIRGNTDFLPHLSGTETVRPRGP